LTPLFQRAEAVREGEAKRRDEADERTGVRKGIAYTRELLARI